MIDLDAIVYRSSSSNLHYFGEDNERRARVWACALVANPFGERKTGSAVYVTVFRDGDGAIGEARRDFPRKKPADYVPPVKLIRELIREATE